MEALTILLSGLIGLVSPLGFVVDRTAESTIRQQFQAVEQLQVRVDNAPSYQLLQGKVDQVWIAGRGLYPVKDLRIAVLELETDAVAVNPNSLGQGRPQLEQPFNAGVRLVVTQADINQALRSPSLNAQFRNLTINLPNFPQGEDLQRYEFLNPQVEFLAENRVRFQIELREQKTKERLLIQAESNIQILAGRKLQLSDAMVAVNGETVPDEILGPIIKGLNQRADLRSLEATGITARIIQFKITPNQQVEVAAVVHADPTPPSR